MFKIGDVAPDIAGLMAKHEAHAAECRAEVCERCDKRPPAPPLTPEDLAELRDKRWSKDARASIPGAFAEVSLTAPWLAKLVGAQAMAQAHQALSATRVALLGPPGSGKTSLAVAMFHAAIAREPALTWGSARHLYTSSHKLAKARAGHPLGGGDAPLVMQALETPLLLIDELGGEDARHASAVAEVIYERHAEDMPTWVTTGTSPEKLADRYGGGIARRLLEGATVIRLVGRTR